MEHYAMESRPSRRRHLPVSAAVAAAVLVMTLLAFAAGASGPQASAVHSDDDIPMSVQDVGDNPSDPALQAPPDEDMLAQVEWELETGLIPVPMDSPEEIGYVRRADLDRSTSLDILVPVTSLDGVLLGGTGTAEGFVSLDEILDRNLTLLGE